MNVTVRQLKNAAGLGPIRLPLDDTKHPGAAMFGWAGTGESTLRTRNQKHASQTFGVGPNFGIRGELRVVSNANENYNSWTGIGSQGIFHRPAGCNRETFFTGESHFRAEEVEVYSCSENTEACSCYNFRLLNLCVAVPVPTRFSFTQ